MKARMRQRNVFPQGVYLKTQNHSYHPGTFSESTGGHSDEQRSKAGWAIAFCMRIPKLRTVDIKVSYTWKESKKS